MSNLAELTAKQARFVAEYLVDGNGAGAAVRAGYGVGGAKVAACRLLTKDNVQEALQARQAADATRLGLRRIEVLRGFLVAVEKAREMGDPAAMISGLREVGRLMGYYPANRVKVDLAVTTDVHTDRMNRLSDAELMKIIEASGHGAGDGQPTAPLTVIANNG